MGKCWGNKLGKHRPLSHETILIHAIIKWFVCVGGWVGYCKDSRVVLRGITHLNVQNKMSTWIYVFFFYNI